MYHRNGRMQVMKRSIPVFNMIFVLHVMPITMVQAVLAFVGHVTINLATIRVHRPAPLCAYQDGRETIVPKVNHLIISLDNIK